MEKKAKTIYEKTQDSIKEELAGTTLKGSVKAVVSLLPFFGELINSTIPDIYRLYKTSYFNDFIRGINAQLESMSFSEAEYKEFEAKLSNPSNYKYLSVIIDSVFFSKSTRSRAVLGIIMANYINDNTVPYEEIIIINALKELIDAELDTFEKIYEVAIGVGKEETNGEGAFYINYYPNNILVNTTFAKLIGLHIIGNKAESLYSKSPGSLHGNVTSITRKLKHYMDLTKEEHDE